MLDKNVLDYFKLELRNPEVRVRLWPVKDVVWPTVEQGRRMVRVKRRAYWELAYWPGGSKGIRQKTQYGQL